MPRFRVLVDGDPALDAVFVPGPAVIRLHGARDGRALVSVSPCGEAAGGGRGDAETRRRGARKKRAQLRLFDPSEV